MTHVFISYVRDNEDDVKRLSDTLKTNGAIVWRDRVSIEAGTRWKNEIEKAIRKGEFFVACFSKEWQQRKETYMNKELDCAIDELRKRSSDRTWFIPVLLSNCRIPEYKLSAGETIEDLQWVDLSSDWETGIQNILNVINPIPADVQMHMAALSSTDPSVRIAAAGELGRIGNRRAVPSLIEALNDPDMHVRADVARALSQIPDIRAIPALIKALVDKEHYKVCMQAQAALISIGKDAIPGLEQAASQNDNLAIKNAARSLLQVMKPGFLHS